MAVDEWCPVTNPFTHTQHGQLRVVLAMGSEEQVIKCSPFMSLLLNIEWSLNFLELLLTKMTDLFAVKRRC